MRLPRSHPRYESLKTRELLVDYLEEGILVHAGLIAHGRGEAFDYLLGERTIPAAKTAEKAAAALLLNSDRPVISVNGNTAVIAGRDIGRLSRVTGAAVEVNMFHWSKERGMKIAALLKESGATKILFADEKRIPGLDHARARCTWAGIYSADTVLVPLEDGDRAQALVRMGKTVISIDLNPLSRTSMTATVSIVDEVGRAIRKITAYASLLSNREKEIRHVITSYNNRKVISDVLKHLDKRLKRLSQDLLVSSFA